MEISAHIEELHHSVELVVRAVQGGEAPDLVPVDQTYLAIVGDHKVGVSAQEVIARRDGKVLDR